MIIRRPQTWEVFMILQVKRDLPANLVGKHGGGGGGRYLMGVWKVVGAALHILFFCRSDFTGVSYVIPAVCSLIRWVCDFSTVTPIM